MQLAIQLIERYLGPKASAAVAGAGVAYTQITERMAETGGDPVSVVLTALESGSFASLIPAPVAAIAAFALRKTKKEVTEDHYDAQGNLVKSAKPATFEEQTVSQIESLNEASQYWSDAQNSIEDEISSLRDSYNTQFLQMKELFNKLGVRFDEVSDYNNGRLISVERELEELRNTVDTAARAIELVHKRQDPATYHPKKDEHGIPTEKIPDQVRDVSKGPQPLNVRNNNPGNIRPTGEGRTPWKGESESNNAYAYFEDPVMGARAMLYLLRRSYFARRGLNTVEKIINRWSPYGDPGNSTAAVDNYKKFVADALNVDVNQVINIEKKDTLVDLAIAMAHYEGGKPFPFSRETWYEAEKLV